MYLTGKILTFLKLGSTAAFIIHPSFITSEFAANYKINTQTHRHT